MTGSTESLHKCNREDNRVRITSMEHTLTRKKTTQMAICNMTKILKKILQHQQQQRIDAEKDTKIGTHIQLKNTHKKRNINKTSKKKEKKSI